MTLDSSSNNFNLETLASKTLDLETLEIKLLLDAIEGQYGYDFHNYAYSSLKRRIQHFASMEKFDSIAAIIPKILHDPHCFDRFLIEMSVSVTKMFRNPLIFKLIREKILPKLRTYPRINIWHAGCATGEEVYSMAIMLAEENLLDKVHIYATDFNNHSLEVAQKAIYPIKGMSEFSKNYLDAGGKTTLSNFYQAKYDAVKFSEFLKHNITFAHHNLMQDQAFGEMNVIFCRNVLIYFNQILQNQVLDMMKGCLTHRGFLILGDRETLSFSSCENDFIELLSRTRIFQKKADATIYER